MNRDELRGRWRQLRGTIRKAWGKLTDNDLEQIAGDYDKLVGGIQEHYGGTRASIQRRLTALHRAHMRQR